jgi:hypothetical protein
MTTAQFYKLALSLWGEKWRPELIALLAAHGLSYTRQSLWNWQTAKRPVPLEVSEILKAEDNRRKVAKLNKSLAGYYKSKRS